MNCRICGNDKNLRRHVAREMMFGTREQFSYQQCSACGCLQIEAFPADMAKHYPPAYYAQQDEEKFPALVKFLLGRRDRYAFQGRGVIGKWVNSLLGNQALESLGRMKLSPDARILDVGCGAGALLKSLRRFGFTRLHGVDPFNANDLRFDEHLEIRKAELRELSGEWDVIMLHHVFEHIPDPLATLREIHARLTPNGTCLIRIPLVSSFAWEQYGVNWVQLDAPRHFFLHSLESVERLARAAGLRVAEVVFDSTSFQFWGSELYQSDVPLQAARGDTRAFFKRFPLKTLRAFARRAAELNRERRGDQAAFYLKKLS